MSEIVKLPFYGKGGWKQSATDKWMDVMDPSTGQAIAKAPCCTAAEVDEAVAQAAEAYRTWSRTPVIRRTQVLFRFRELLMEHMDELTYILARENGKVWDEARGDLLKVKEPVELACGAPALMMGESLMDTSSGYDTVLYREPLGVFAGIAPFNFPAMIPMGWMAPLCIATGNTMVIKASSTTPMTSIRLLELLEEAGLPQGVVSVLTTGRDNAQALLSDPRIKGVCFVGTTGAGLKILRRSSQRQAGAGALRGQEPRPCHGRRGAGADSQGDHQLRVRLRGRALYGPACGGGPGGRRGPAGGAPGPACRAAQGGLRL